MIWEIAVKSKAVVSGFREVVSKLHSINGFGILLEVGANRNAPQPTAELQVSAALRAAWHDGYVEALRDLCYFEERYVPSDEKGIAPNPNFGAAKELLKSGEITQDEFDELTSNVIK